MGRDKKLIGIFGVFQYPDKPSFQGSVMGPESERAFSEAIARMRNIHKDHILAQLHINYIVRIYAR